MSRTDILMKVAWAYVGCWYRWGGDDPSGFDCSGFVVECLKSVGVLPHEGDWTAEALWRRYSGRLVSVPRRGDLAFWKDKAGKIIHVELCVNDVFSIGASGGNRQICTTDEAAAANAFVKIRPLDCHHESLAGYLRVIS
jgi:D-gamma-glutamyl-meso-diaminopimelic acid endopeptidase CwlS